MCKIPGCPNPPVAQGLCAKHYMRQRRTGDATVTRKPGVDLTAWRKKVAALERELAQAQAMAKPSASCAACAEKDSEIARLKDESVQHRRVADAEMAVIGLRRELAAKPKAPPRPLRSETEVAELQRQLKGLHTQIKNLKLEKKHSWAVARDKTALVVSKRQRNVLLKVFHPDKEAGVSAARKAELEEGFNIIFGKIKTPDEGGG